MVKKKSTMEWKLKHLEKLSKVVSACRPGCHPGEDEERFQNFSQSSFYRRTAGATLSHLAHTLMRFFMQKACAGTAITREAAKNRLTTAHMLIERTTRTESAKIVTWAPTTEREEPRKKEIRISSKEIKFLETTSRRWLIAPKHPKETRSSECF